MMWQMMPTGRSKALRLATLASQAGNVVLFDGSEDETISGRAYRLGVLGGCPVWARRAEFIDRVFWFDPDHCRKSHEVDIINAAPFCEILAGALGLYCDKGRKLYPLKTRPYEEKI